MAEPPKDDPVPKPGTAGPTHPVAAPVAKPAPPMDGPKPVPAGPDQVEKFNVATDTGGGE